MLNCWLLLKRTNLFRNRLLRDSEPEQAFQRPPNQVLTSGIMFTKWQKHQPHSAAAAVKTPSFPKRLQEKHK